MVSRYKPKSCEILRFDYPFGNFINDYTPYDKNGNLVSGDGYYREYNELNQLIRIRSTNLISVPILEEFVWHPTEERSLILHVQCFNT